MTFTNLADEIKEKNFNKNVIVFSDAKVLSKWPNFNPVSERYLNDIGIRKEIKHTISREKL
jgi:hypothetical protein